MTVPARIKNIPYMTPLETQEDYGTHYRGIAKSPMVWVLREGFYEASGPLPWASMGRAVVQRGWKGPPKQYTPLHV